MSQTWPKDQPRHCVSSPSSKLPNVSVLHCCTHQKKSSEHKQKSTRDMWAKIHWLRLISLYRKLQLKQPPELRKRKSLSTHIFASFAHFFSLSQKRNRFTLLSWLCSELLSEEPLTFAFFSPLLLASLHQKLQQREKRNEMVNKNWKFFYLFSSPSCLHAHDPARIFSLFSSARSTLSPHLYSIPSDWRWRRRR